MGLANAREQAAFRLLLKTSLPQWAATPLEGLARPCDAPYVGLLASVGHAT